MSATNIQWITIAVLGFGAVFAFFVLVFVFEATVHALRYRDQYAGGGGGFRMPSFGGRQGSGFSPGEPSNSPRSVRQRDPHVNRALAREAARIAADERTRSGEVRLRPVPNVGEEPAPADAQDEAEPIELVAQDDDAVLDLSEAAETDDNIQPFVAEPHAVDTSDDVVNVQANENVELSADGNKEDGAKADGVTEIAEESAQDQPQQRLLVAEPLVLTAKHEVTLDKAVSKPKAGRVTMRATKGPLIAAESTFRRHSGEPPRLDKDDLPPLTDEAPKSSEAQVPQFEARQPKLDAQTTTGLPEKRLSELRQAEVAKATATKPVETVTAPAPAVTEASAEKVDSRKPEQPEESVLATAPQTDDSTASRATEPDAMSQVAPTVQANATPDTASPTAQVEADRAPEPARTSKVAQPSQPESEVMADTTRQLKSLRDAEEFGGGPQTGEASCPLYLRYRSASGIVFDRIVQAVTLEEANGEWIMRAFCHRSKAMRRIRVSNVAAAFDLRNRDVSVGDKVSDFLRDRVPLRDSSGSGKSSEGGAPPAAAE